MQARHRKEQRDLVSRITSKKKNATKKTRKFVNDECAELERQLKERHETELRNLSGGDENEQDDDTEQQQPTDSEPAINNLAATLQTTALSSPSPPSPPSQQAQAQEPEQEKDQPKQKRNRQKERLARRAAEQETAAAAAEAEAGSMTDHRGQERVAMQQTFGAHGLREQEIAPDGHCLFSAVADQLAVLGISVNDSGGGGKGGKGESVELGERPKVIPYRLVRRAAAEWIAGHRDEYAGFLEEGVDEYVERIRDTAEWGGQLELSALANAYGVEIRVVQGGERIEVVSPAEKGEGNEVKTLWLAYYRHGYGLGEHYNSLRKAV